MCFVVCGISIIYTFITILSNTRFVLAKITRKAVDNRPESQLSL